MLGWHITVYRPGSPEPLANCPDVPALVEKLSGESYLGAIGDALVTGPKLAVWQTGQGGLRWIYDLVDEGLAIDFASNGYPSIYAALARDILPKVRGGPPEANSTWSRGEHDIVTPAWAGSTVMGSAAMAKCGDTDWLVIEAWDES